jgi:hypothetical protein
MKRPNGLRELRLKMSKKVEITLGIFILLLVENIEKTKKKSA